MNPNTEHPSEKLIMEAIVNAHHTALTELCSHTDLLSPGVNVATIFWAAIIKRDLRSLSILLDSGLDPNSVDVTGDTPLVCAIKMGYASGVELLLDRGADVNVQIDEDYFPIHYVIFAYENLTGNGYGCHEMILDVLQMLIKYGADVNAISALGLTPLRLAVEFSWKDAARILYNKGADPTISDTNGVSSASVARLQGFDFL